MMDDTHKEDFAASLQQAGHDDSGASLVQEDEMRQQLDEFDSSFVRSVSPVPPTPGMTRHNYLMSEPEEGLDPQSEADDMASAIEIKAQQGSEDITRSQEGIQDENGQSSRAPLMTLSDRNEDEAETRLPDNAKSPEIHSRAGRHQSGSPRASMASQTASEFLDVRPQQDQRETFTKEPATLEMWSSSPTVAAAARTVTRVLSARADTSQSSDRHSRELSSVVDLKDEHENSSNRNADVDVDTRSPSEPQPTDQDATPRRSERQRAKQQDDLNDTPRVRRQLRYRSEEEDENDSATHTTTSRSTSNGAKHIPLDGMSVQSFTTTDGGRDSFSGADSILQFVDTVPQRISVSDTGQSRASARSARSLGSLVSALTISDDEAELNSNHTRSHSSSEASLASHTPKTAVGSRQHMADNALNSADQGSKETPRMSTREPNTPLPRNHPDDARNYPTNTVIAQHVQNVHVPATLARDYASRFSQPHLEPGTAKRARMMTPGGNVGSQKLSNGVPMSNIGIGGNHLTLKEQSNTIDRLMKENWNLKLKITFLDEALNRQSDESVKAMISENVELRTAKFQSAKDTRDLKRTIRDLERRLEEHSRDSKNTAKEEKGAGNDYTKLQRIHENTLEEVTKLKSRITESEEETVRLRQERDSHAVEKEGLAESLAEALRHSQDRDSKSHSQENAWQDLYKLELARRKQADETASKLRHEIEHMRESGSQLGRDDIEHSRGLGQHSGGDQNRPYSSADTAQITRLKEENVELRREVGAQASMLTSRNRERDRLQQEIESLKLGLSHRSEQSMTSKRGRERSTDQSMTGRSANRPYSRSSEISGTNLTNFTDHSEILEKKNGLLREQNAALRLEIEALTSQAEQALDELEQLDHVRIDHQKLQDLYDNDMSLATEDLQNLQRERDEALRFQEDLEADIQDMKLEGNEKIAALEEELQNRNTEIYRLQNELSNHAEDSEALRKEVRALSERILHIQDELDSRGARIKDLQLELAELGHEADALDKEVRSEKDRHSQLSVQHESAQSEITFLRDEQEGDKMKIGDLENALRGLQESLRQEQDRARRIDSQVAEERRQRDALDAQEKLNADKMKSLADRDIVAARDESEKLRSELHHRERESTSYRERLSELENHLCEILGEPRGTSRSTFLSLITSLQKEVQTTSGELDSLRHELGESERLLRSRDALLESHGVETKKLVNQLDRERQARRAEKGQYEQWQANQSHTAHSVTQRDARISELERKSAADRKKLVALEQQHGDQLTRRNALLLDLWHRISKLCGADWHHRNSLIDNHLPTVEVISKDKIFTPFSQNLLSALGNVQTILDDLRHQAEKKDMTASKTQQELENQLELRNSQVQQLEATIQGQKVNSTFSAAPEIAKLRGENRLLKSELAVLHKQEMAVRRVQRQQEEFGDQNVVDADDAAPSPSVLSRHHSASTVDGHSLSMSLKRMYPLSPSRGNSSRRNSKVISGAMSGGMSLSGSNSTSNSTLASQDKELNAQNHVQRSESEHRLSHNRTSHNSDNPNLNVDHAQARVAAEDSASQQRWIHRLKELERRLKAEREARLLDRSGARRRLEEGVEENRRLKDELEREKIRKEMQT